MARDLVLEVIEQVRGNALGEAARDLDQVAAKTDVAADSARDYSGELKNLDTQIAATRLKIQGLGAEFVSTQDKMTGKELRGERSLLGQLERIRKELEDAAPDLAPAGAAVGAAMGGKAGASFIGAFFDSIGSLPSKLKGSLLVAAVGIGVLASPIIGASIAGAVVGAVGAGGIAGGIGAASNDPQVRAAATAFSKSISAQFFAGGQSFVQPTIESLGILEKAFADMDLGDSWARVAPYVTTVATGIAGLGREFMPGFNRALDAAGPGLVLFAEELPHIGAALGDVIGDIAQSEGALEGLLFVLKFVESTIRVTGSAVVWLSDRFHDLVATGAEATGVMEDMPNFQLIGWLSGGAFSMAKFNDQLENMRDRAHAVEGGLHGIGDALPQATRGMYAQGEAAHALADAVRRLHEEYTDLLGVQMSQDQANRRVQEGLLSLAKTLKENGKDWRDNTEAGLANRAALSSQVEALIRQRQANIDAGMSASDATTRFEAELNALSRLAVQAGISKEALADLVGDYFVRVHVTTTGDAAYRAAITRALQGGDGFRGFQHGGEPPIGEPFWVGEGGKPELMQLSPRPRVYSHQQSQAMTAASGASARQTAEALAEIAQTLKRLEQRQPTVINVHAAEGMSPKELSAVVAREMAWSR